MDNLINETNSRLQEIIDNLTTIKNEYESKLDKNNESINSELDKVKKYKSDFFSAKQKVEKMNDDINGFEEDYKNLVDRFKDDELANILIAANKEISAKIDERKRKIAKDKVAMNELVEKAEASKNKLVKLTAEKKALELCLTKILDAYEFYTKSLQQIISYAEDNQGNLAACFYEKSDELNNIDVEKIEENIEEDIEEISENDEESQFEDDYIIEENVEYDESEIDDDNSDDETHEEDIEEDDDDYEDVNDNENHESILEEIEEDIEDIIIEEDDDEIDDEEISEVESVNIEDIEIESDDVNDNEDEIESIEEEISDYDNEDVIEGDEHKIVMEEIPSTTYDYNENLDLENIINFDDSLEDDDTLYNEKENEE